MPDEESRWDQVKTIEFIGFGPDPTPLRTTGFSPDPELVEAFVGLAEHGFGFYGFEHLVERRTDH